MKKYWQIRRNRANSLEAITLTFINGYGRYCIAESGFFNLTTGKFTGRKFPFSRQGEACRAARRHDPQDSGEISEEFSVLQLHAAAFCNILWHMNLIYAYFNEIRGGFYGG